MEDLSSLSDKDLVKNLAEFGFSFVDGSSSSQRIEKAPVMVLSSPGANTPLIRFFTFQFRWENYSLVEPVLEAQQENVNNRDSLWISLDFNLYRNCFEVSPAKVKVTPKGLPVPAYRAYTLFKRGRSVELFSSGEIIRNAKDYEALNDYKQKDFDTEIVGAYMIERIRRYLRFHQIFVSYEDVHGRNDSDHLRHVLTDEQVTFVCDQMNMFIKGERGIYEDFTYIPRNEINKEPNLRV